MCIVMAKTTCCGENLSLFLTIEKIASKVKLVEENDGGTVKAFATMLDSIKPKEKDIAIAVICAKRGSVFARMVAQEYRSMKGDHNVLPAWI